MNVGGQFMLVLRFSVATEQHRSFLWFWLFVKLTQKFYRLPTTYQYVRGVGGGEEATCWYCAPHEQLFAEIRISLCQTIWLLLHRSMNTFGSTVTNTCFPRSHFVGLLMTAVRTVRESILRLCEGCELDLSSFTFPYVSPASAVKELSSCQWKYER
jgi:hypothetical protein